MLLAVLVLTLTTAALAQEPSAMLAQKSKSATEAAKLLAIAQQKGHVRVIVAFDSPVAAHQLRPDAASLAIVTSGVAATQDDIIARHFGSASSPTAGQGSVRGISRFPITPGFAVNVTGAELDALAADPQVVHIQHDRPVPPALSQSVPLIGMPAAYAKGATGSGQVVAVLDTGVQANHEFLAGKVVAEACFSNGGGGGGGVSLCPNGQPTQTGAGAASPNTEQCIWRAAFFLPDAELCDHGTHVAGIAAGFKSPPSPDEPPNGVAKDAGIFAIQVFTRFNNPENNSDCVGIGVDVGQPCVHSIPSDMILALDHVYFNLGPGGLDVASVNMSIGGGQYVSCQGDEIQAPIDRLRREGV